MNQQLLDAARRGDLARVEQALQNGANVDVTDNNGKTPLHWACLCGHLDVVQYLLTSHDANLEATDNRWLDDLFTGGPVCNGHLDVAQYLLTSHDANLEATDNTGKTPLHLACWNGHLDVVQYLLTSHGANLEATDNEGNGHLCTGPAIVVVWTLSE